MTALHWTILGYVVAGLIYVAWQWHVLEEPFWEMFAKEPSMAAVPRSLVTVMLLFIMAVEVIIWPVELARDLWARFGPSHDEELDE